MTRLVTTMEDWPCCGEHGARCVLKTGTRPGPSFGRNYFICSRITPCRFVLSATAAPTMACPVHEQMVTVRCPTKDKNKMIRYRCKRSKGSWCGLTQWNEDKENCSPTLSPVKKRVVVSSEEEKEEEGEDEEGEEEEKEVGGEGEEEWEEETEEGGVEVRVEDETELGEFEEVQEVDEGEEEEEGEAREVEEVQEEVEGDVGESEASGGGGEEVVEVEKAPSPEEIEEGGLEERVEDETELGEFEEVQEVDEGEEEEEGEVREVEVEGDVGESEASGGGGEEVVEVEKAPSPEFKVGSQYKTLCRQLHQIESLLQNMAHKLPDGGAKLRQQGDMVMKRITELKRVPPPDLSISRPVHAPSGGDKLFQKGLNLQARLLTSGVVEQLHRSLETCPTADTLAPQPSALTATLFTHQQRALAWLLWRERQTPSGGILADEMGLGKTLSMIALILQNPSDHSHHSDGLVSSRATLVVCAPSLIHQWAAEIDSRLHHNTLSVVIYHGCKRTKCPLGLANHDVVITTYDTVGAEGASALDSEGTGGKRRRRMASTTTLFQVYWYRVVLDEGHKIRNPKTAMAVGVCGLKKVHRWAVTGTPVQNKLTDLYSLIKFLELAPFDDIREWKHSIEKKSVVGMQRLRTMIAVLVLRRTKEDIASTLKLPDKIINTHTLDLGMEEQNIYDALFTEARKVFVSWLAEKRGEGEETDSPAKTNSTGNTSPPVLLPPPVQHCLDNILASFSVGRGAVLVMLLRLRQCCCHPGLMVGGAQDVDLEEGLEEALESLSLDHVTRLKDVSLLPPPFREQRLSTKICEVLREMRRIRGLDPPEKCIIVSQWKSLLDIVRYQLDSTGISWTSIDSRVSPKQRSLNVLSFNSAKPDPSVMLLSMIAGGEGLNLVGGNHIFMLDLHWNPSVELQATDRAHRVGQTRNVYVHRFVCRGTVEERIQLLQTRKLQLSASVLSGASGPKQGNKLLTLQDLKVLFQVE